MKLRLPQSRKLRALIYGGAATLVLLAIDMLWVRAGRHITVSPETTHITSPLKPSGMPDYLLYLDDRAHDGVTADNNAAIPFLQVITPMRRDSATGSDVVMAEYYERFGLVSPPAPLRMAALSSFAGTMPATYPAGDSEDSFIRTHPWLPAEHPAAEAWLKSLEKPLGALPAITARIRWYMPLIRSQSDMLIAVLLPYLTDMRALEHAAMTRAMERIGEKRYAEAAADILACHRLARLFGQGWTIIEYLVATVMDQDALKADLILASAPGLSAEELRKFQQDLAALPPWPERLADNLDMERVALLDTLIWVSQHPGEADTLINSVSARPSSFNPLAVALRPSNFNAAMRQANQQFDRMVSAARADTPAKRQELAIQADADFRNLVAGDLGRFGDTARRVMAITVPAVKDLFTTRDNHETTRNLTRVAVALVVFRMENGKYPAELTELTPKYLATVPDDSYSGHPFRYQSSGEGFLLYSVGPNFKDDAGKTQVEDKQDYDLVVKMPQ